MHCRAVGTGEGGTVHQNGFKGPLSYDFSKIFQNVLKMNPRAKQRCLGMIAVIIDGSRLV